MVFLELMRDGKLLFDYIIQFQLIQFTIPGWDKYMQHLIQLLVCRKEVFSNEKNGCNAISAYFSFIDD